MKLNTKRTVTVGFAFMSIMAFWQVYDNIVPLILKNTFNINDTLSGVIMALDNILAIFLLPLFGSLSDRVNTRLGKRMPFILWGTIAACIFSMLLPIADRLRSLPLFMTALGLVLLAMATYRSPAVALMPDVTPKPLRSKANAIINLTGSVGGILMLLIIGVTVPKTEQPSYIPVYAIMAAFMLICLAVLLIFVREPKLSALMREESKQLGEEVETLEAKTEGSHMTPAVKKSFFLILTSIFLWFMGYNAVTTAFSKYAQVYWGLEGGIFAYTLIVAQGAAIISYIPVGIVSSKIGRRKTILGGIVLLTLAFASSVISKSFSTMIFFFFVLAGVGWAAINVNSYPMVVEMSKGADVGKYTGYYYTVSMAAQIITPILSGAVLEYGYLALGSANPDAGYVFLFPYGALFTTLSFVTMLFVKHGDSKALKKKDTIENFDID
ncbi:MAG: SLC45 family MFS transporter [Papillibacter sp.]|nr:SLC45 family MFS transporter [Papillibacter sp.]